MIAFIQPAQDILHLTPLHAVRIQCSGNWFTISWSCRHSVYNRQMSSLKGSLINTSSNCNRGISAISEGNKSNRGKCKIADNLFELSVGDRTSVRNIKWRILRRFNAAVFLCSTPVVWLSQSRACGQSEINFTSPCNKLIPTGNVRPLSLKKNRQYKAIIYWPCRWSLQHSLRDLLYIFYSEHDAQ